MRARLHRSSRIAGILVGGFACLLAVVFSLEASGQAIDPTIAQFQHTAWTAKDGSPSQISNLAQTTDGYLWIGSTQGLFRFDGIKFERYEPPQGVKLPSYNIYALLALPDGGLWVSFRPSGLALIKDGTITVLSGPKEVTKVEVFTLARDLDGRIWAGTRKGLMLYDGVRWTSITQDWNLMPRMIRHLLVDRDGTLWVATDESIYFLRRRAKAFQPTGLHTNLLARLAQSKDGRIWFADNILGIGAIPIDGQTEGPRVHPTGLVPGDVLFSADGSMWIAELDSGLFRVRLSEQTANRIFLQPDLPFEPFREKDGLTSDTVVNLLEDHEGDIWVSTAKGLDRFRRTPLVPVSLPNTYEKLTLSPGEGGYIWVGSAITQPILRVHQGSNQILGPTSLAGVASAYRDPSGDVWWGAYQGIMRQRGDDFEFFLQPKDALPDFSWAIFTSGDDGGLWVNFGDLGLLHFKDGVWDKRAAPAGLPDRGPSATYTDPAGRIWLGYTENRVRLLEHGQVVASYSGNDGISIGRVKVIAGPGPHFWFGGELGLALFQNGKFWTVNVPGHEQLRTISGIVEAKDGSLWLNEMQGIIRISAEEVRQLLANPEHDARFRRFDFFDGLRGLPQLNFTSSTAVQATDGRLWFATDNGLVWIDPEHIPQNLIPPPVAIVSISSTRESSDTRTLADRALRFAAGTRQIEVDYTALSLAVPERVQFQYRLDSVDTEWQTVGNRRQAFYTNLRPGKYRFRVTACNEDGACNEEGAALEFSIAPAFYQTGWFAVLCLILTMGLLWAVYAARFRYLTVRIRDRAEERSNERVRIARDLHDTLLQSFHGLLLSFQTAYDLLPKRAVEAKETLGSAIDEAADAITEGRDAVEGLRSSMDDSNDIVESIRTIGEDLLRDGSDSTSPAFLVEVEGTPRNLPPLLQGEVYRVASEALRNAFRHAQARTIEVEIHYDEREFRLKVRDDGKGIHPDVLARNGRVGHYGLHGMRERAMLVGGKLALWSETDSGTEIELAIPAAYAYTASHRRSWWLEKFYGNRVDKTRTRMKS